jgi:hypothetical protein
MATGIAAGDDGAATGVAAEATGGGMAGELGGVAVRDEGGGGLANTLITALAMGIVEPVAADVSGLAADDGATVASDEETEAGGSDVVAVSVGRVAPGLTGTTNSPGVGVGVEVTGFMDWAVADVLEIGAAGAVLVVARGVTASGGFRSADLGCRDRGGNFGFVLHFSPLLPSAGD